MAKEFTYRGKTVEELKAMPLEEFGKLCNSRSRRTLKEGIDKQLMAKVLKYRQNDLKQKVIRTHRRDVVVIPQMIGTKIALYRGNSFETIDIKPAMLGHYLGEFAFTRKKVKHGKAGIGATKSSTAISERK